MTRQKTPENESHELQATGSEILESSAAKVFRDNARPLLDRATEMLQSRPYLTVGAAVGVGFLLGVSVVRRFGRLVVLSAAGLGSDLLREAAKAHLSETPPRPTS
jgi:hypothetical protein